jgi:type IV fimbrial biogenesis protein FimT
VLKIKSFHYGVSLVEIMIGLAIMAILLVAGAPSFSTFLQNSQIRNAAEALQNGMTLARVEAVRRNTNVQFVLDTSNYSWAVRCAIAVGDLNGDGVPDCPGLLPNPTTPANIQARDAVEGSKNAVVTATLPTINFNGMGKVANLAASSTATFAVTNATGACVPTGQMRCLNVVVTPGGQVRMCDPTLSSPDPQAC